MGIARNLANYLRGRKKSEAGTISDRNEPLEMVYSLRHNISGEIRCLRTEKGVITESTTKPLRDFIHQDLSGIVRINPSKYKDIFSWQGGVEGSYEVFRPVNGEKDAVLYLDLENSHYDRSLKFIIPLHKKTPPFVLRHFYEVQRGEKWAELYTRGKVNGDLDEWCGLYDLVNSDVKIV